MFIGHIPQCRRRITPLLGIKHCYKSMKEQKMDYEKQINQMVYKNYDLAPEKIEIVEKNRN